MGDEVFAGNRAGSKTGKGTEEAVEAREGKSDRVWVKDRGMGSEDILKWMQESGRR